MRKIMEGIKEHSKQREYKRKNLVYDLCVYDKETNVQIGFMTDISERGLMLVTNSPLETDRIYSLRIQCPDHAMVHDDFAFTAKSIWCHLAANQKNYDVGLEVIDGLGMYPENARALMKFLSFDIGD